jgi:acyl-CoA reductase-like NAD-dependent aldehyde dehydrogenase
MSSRANDGSLTLSSVEDRKQSLKNLGDFLQDVSSHRRFIKAYIQDTGFVHSQVVKRELFAPSTLLRMAGNKNDIVSQSGLDISYGDRRALGKVAVLLPKNALGLTMAKAVAASHLMGNETIIRLPSSLSNTRPIYCDMLSSYLDNIEFSSPEQSAKQFLTECIVDSGIDSIVIYGDDKWIDDYRELATHHQKHVLFEGPGNDPMIVLESADVQSSVEAALRCGLNNGGQSCSALERFFVHTSLIDEFSAALIEKLKCLKCGFPEEPDTDIGPIVSRKLITRLMLQLREAESQGAKIISGGELNENFYRGWPLLSPVVLANCSHDMSVVRDENFGPVFPIVKFDKVESLIPIIDDSLYGLNASVFGNCPSNLSDYLESCHRNVYYNSTAVDTDNLPSRIIDGGYKRSGFVWQQMQDKYVDETGRRYLPKELSKA